MYLKKLSIQGFKSFVSATDLQFDPGITAIVGPNGCGKSNIVDALRWVIGEQRARVLRSDRMDSVIFNGTSHRRAMGLAEVQLTIANTRGVLPLEYSEVTLGRRLYRSGEAEYLLNGVTCRLLDITDLFTDTGMGAGAYSVIELKMIDQILSENTQDRRRLFEEASGITRYKNRRTDALRKLDHMQSDLDRVRDLTDEISSQVRSLKRQATIAERYLRYKTELRTAQVNLLRLEYGRHEAEEKILTDEIANFSDICSDLAAQVHSCEAQQELLRTKLVAEEKRSKRNRQAFVEHEQRIIKLEGDLRLEKANQDSIAEKLVRLARDREVVDSELEELVQQYESTQQALSVASSEAGKTEDLRDQAADQRNRAREHLQASELKWETLTTTVNHLNQEKNDSQRQTDQLQSRIFHLKDEMDRLAEEIKSKEQINRDAIKSADRAELKLKKAQKDLEHVSAERQKAEASHAALDVKIADAERAVQMEETHLAAKDAEVTILLDLISAYDFLPDAVRYLLTDVTDIEVTPLTDLISCSSEYRAALTASLEPYGGCIVAETELAAKEAAQRLRTEDKGMAYFIILENIPSILIDEEYPPNALLAHIGLRNEIYKPIVQLLLGDVILIESLDAARALLSGEGGRSHRYVTSEGEWVDGRGVLYAGGNEEGGMYSHLARRDSLRAAQEASSELRDQLEKAKSILTAVQVEQQQIQLPKLIQGTRSAEKIVSEADHTAQKYLQIRELGLNQVTSLQSRQQQIAQEIAELESEAQPCGDQLSHIDEELDRAKDQVKSIDEEILSWKDKLDQMQNLYVTAQTSAVQAVANRERLESDLKRIEQGQQSLNFRAMRHCQDQSDLEEMQQSAASKVKMMTKRLKTERASRKDLDAINAQDSSREHELRLELEQVNERVRNARRELQDARLEETNIRVKHSAVKARRKDVVVRAQENFGVELTSISVSDGNEDSLKEQIQETERKLQSMGNVNALALEEYEKQNERLEFMISQRADLEEAEQTLVSTINEINRTASKQFLDTYTLIQDNFQVLFCELFGEKAKCELSLTNSSDPLESPIAVTARPSGKRPVSIAQLSSGEKTLTAIALLFAIYMIKPSPFCFLDEVDAPLDDTNVDHFMRIIRRFSSNTQFVLVTHNKRTMEMANRLYGITMQEEGVSSLVSVRFDEVGAMGI